MKTISAFIALILCTFSVNVQAHKQNLNDLLQNGKKLFPVNTAGLSNDEVVKGLREALQVGTGKAVETVSSNNGFFKNPSIKIPFPPETKKMEQTLRSIGMGAQTDAFVESLNRAAEKATASATPIFVEAIKNMSISDGKSILKGKSDEATRFLEKQTGNALTQKFTPIVQEALRKVEVTKYWNPLVTAYNRMPMVQKVNPNLEKYVTEKALKGLFATLAKEEEAIRQNPEKRVSELLKKVFANQ